MSVEISTKPTPAAVSAPTPVSGTENMERICDNQDCAIVKLVSMVPKRKTAQIIIEPTIIEKPMLINGFTTVFQVDGKAATMNDLITPTEEEQTTIYRIKPDTHAHIINYVVVDGKGECLRKINAGEPNIMRKLLESQRSSARQLLKKLMNGPSTKVHVTNSGLPPPPAPPALPNIAITQTTQTLPAVATTTIAPPTVAQAAPATTNNLPVATGNGANIPTTGTQIRGPAAAGQQTKYYAGNANLNRSLPTAENTTNTVVKSTTFRVGPQIKITPVSANAKNNASPLIKTVPLSQLQKPSFNTTTISIVKNTTNSPAGVAKPAAQTTTTTASVEKRRIVAKPLPVAEPKPAAPAPAPTTNNTSDTELFEKMQKELEELRRSVAKLCEAQAINAQSSPAAADTSAATATEPPNKKSRVDSA